MKAEEVLVQRRLFAEVNITNEMSLIRKARFERSWAIKNKYVQF